jgi:pyruvate kinase
LGIENRAQEGQALPMTAREPLPLPLHKTKIVATIGPASESPEMLERLIRAGMSVARLNFSHGDFDGHAARIMRIRAAERAVDRKSVV